MEPEQSSFRDRVGDAEAVAAAAVESALNPESAEADSEVRRQMDGLYRRDRLMGIAFVAGLLVVLPFTVVALWNVVPSDAVRAVLIASACALATYNVASMLKLIRTYGEDKDFIYRRDVAHLRELKATRELGGSGT